VPLSGRSAFSTWAGERTAEPVIVVSEEEAGDRLRFSEAHELGHLVLHFGRAGGRAREVEQEANDFASAFLLPEGWERSGQDHLHQDQSNSIALIIRQLFLRRGFCAANPETNPSPI